MNLNYFYFRYGPLIHYRKPVVWHRINFFLTFWASYRQSGLLVSPDSKNVLSSGHTNRLRSSLQQYLANWIIFFYSPCHWLLDTLVACIGKPKFSFQKAAYRRMIQSSSSTRNFQRHSGIFSDYGLLSFLSFHYWSVDVHFLTCGNGYPWTGSPRIINDC